MFWEIKSERKPFFFFLTMTAPALSQYARDIALYMKARLRYSRTPIDPQPVRPPWLTSPAAQVELEKAIRMLEEAWNHSCKSNNNVRPDMPD